MTAARVRILAILCFILASFALLIAFRLQKTPPTVEIAQSPSPTAPDLSPTQLPTSNNLPTPSRLPTASPNAERRSVFLICWDGGRADLVEGLMTGGKMPNFDTLARRGVRAEYAQSVDPPLSASAQNSISTGSYPARTGIVSNAYHKPSDSFYWYRRGFDEPLDQAEPVWVTASHNGLRTATVFFTGSSPALPSQEADLTIGYGVQDAYSHQETVPLSPLEESWKGKVPASYSPPYEGSFMIGRVARVYLYIVDTSNDNISNYDTVFLNTSRTLEENAQGLHKGDWGPLVLLPATVSGADFKIQNILQAETPRAVTLFYSGINHNTATPRELLEGLNKKFGFFPAGPDYYAVNHNWITPEDNLHLLSRYADWMASVSAWVYTTYQPDLLLTWQDGFDSAGHEFFPQEAIQSGDLAHNASLEAKYYLGAAQIADQALGTMLKAIDLKKTSLLMVSDHGMAPVHTTVYINTILEQAGLLVLDKRNYVVVGKTKAFAVASGGAANIYINLKGHEKDGIVTPEEYPQIQNQIVELLNSVSDETGQKVFQNVLRQDELVKLHLDHPNSGDIFVQVYPGFELDGWRGVDDVFRPSNYSGQHGYDSQLPEMRPFFIAAGSGIPATGQVIPPVKVIDYAPTIAQLLGFAPAAKVEGQPIPGLIQSP